MFIKMLLIVALFTMTASVSAFNDSVNLSELDMRLTNLLLHPEPGKGASLLKDGYFLYTNLDDVSDMIEANDPKGLNIYNKIVAEGGIRFHNANYDPDTVRYTFEYNPDDYETLQATIGGICNTWTNIEMMLNVTTTVQPPKTVDPLTEW